MFAGHDDVESPQVARRDRKEWIVRLSSLVTVVALLCWAPSTLATSPPNLLEAIRAQQDQAFQHPNDPEILNDLGNLLVLAGFLDEAEETYLRSLEINPDNTTTRYNLALVLMEQGQTKQATQELQQVLQVDPYHAWSYYQLGTLSASSGHRKKAVDYYTRALTLRPELSSPAINPHVLENRYLTEAQLRLYLANNEAAQAPRLYQRPGDVAELLLPPVAPESTATPFEELVTEPIAEPDGKTLTRQDVPREQVDPAGGNTEGTTLRERQAATSRQPTDEPPQDEGDPDAEDLDPQAEQADVSDSPRVLSEEDLAPTTVGQGVGYVGSSGQPSSSRSTTRPGGTVSYPRTTTPRSGSGTSAAPPRPQPTQGSDSFVPTVGSTGRLDLELLIEDSSPALVPGP
jgi:tetratricopeptide (TPR) repeat protein